MVGPFNGWPDIAAEFEREMQLALPHLPHYNPQVGEEEEVEEEEEDWGWLEDDSDDYTRTPETVRTMEEVPRWLPWENRPHPLTDTSLPDNLSQHREEEEDAAEEAPSEEDWGN